MTYFVAPDLLRSHLPATLAIDDKILVYERATRGWLLEIARQMGRIEHSGYAQLMVLMAYPERVWQFATGESSHNQSPHAFKQGMLIIAPELVNGHAGHLEALGALYSKVRCGLFHTGAPKDNVALSGEFTAPIRFVQVATAAWGMEINPHLLGDRFLGHHQDFVTLLRDPARTNERTRFDLFFDTTALA
jgi:hypothetical protein